MKIDLDTRLPRDDYFATDRTGRDVRAHCRRLAPQRREEGRINMPNQPITQRLRIAAGSGPQQVARNRRRLSRLRCLTPMVLLALASFAGTVAGQLKEPVDLPFVPPEKMADVILVIKPHATMALNLPTATDRIVEGDIVRLEKGVLPQTIVHTRNTIGSPLQAGVPVKLYLKAFKDGHAHDIINAAPEWWGGQP